MNPRSSFCLCLLVFFVVGIGVTAVAREQPLPDHEVTAVAIAEIAQEPVCNAAPQAAPTFPGSTTLGLQLCSSQAQCEAMCAPFGGFCHRQFCICD